MELPDTLQTSLGSAYTIERELGGGGMSRVFVAEERALGRKVVVKVLQSELAAGVSIDRFKREITLAARLQHPHIVPLLIAGEADGVPYFTMPLVEGESLRARLNRSRLPTDQAVGILRDVAQALEYAHERGVVHRDIKPENILLTGRAAVVTDFGIAKAISSAAKEGTGATLTGLGTVVGTPAYMAPEQAAGDSADPRADIYAWGVIAYEMLSGLHPFAPRTTAQALMAAHIAETPVPVAQRVPTLQTALATLVDRCLAKNPEDRPKDATALLSQLAASEQAALPRGPRVRQRYMVAAGVALIVLASSFGWLWRRSERRQWAREQAIPEADRLAAQNLPLAAFRLRREAQKYAPTDSQIAHSIEAATRVASITSSPPGATVEIQDYITPDSAWLPLGVTPLKQIRIPRGYFRWKFSKPGVGEWVAAPLNERELWIPLDSAVRAPEGMVRVEGGTWADFVAFVGWVGPYKLPAFFLDRFEVTNARYQAFLDSGGYTQPQYWSEKFIQHGRELERDEAMSLFRDRTGRPGPSTWEGGHFPQGKANYPVGGVSWYEASAYCASAGKALPAFAQWYEAAPGDEAGYVVEASNITRDSLAPVGAFHGIGPFGSYDMAGNVREWLLNALDVDRRFIVGGSWRALSYLYADPEALSPFDRTAENGFRCVQNVEPLPLAVTRPVKPLERDFAKAHPASDEVFRAYQAMYAYGTSPLHAKVDAVQDARDWRKEKITFDAAYGNERMTAFLFLPKKVRPPFQTVVFFPSARVLDIASSETLGDTSFFDFVVQSGRAVLYPIYKETYERRVQNGLPGAAQRIELTIQRSRDLGRSLDYLQTRTDIDSSKFAYMGVSMGAAEGVIYAALERDRLKTVIFLDGGFFLDRPPAGGDQVDFAPRLNVPVLMVNGRYDFSFSLERAQLPLFRMLGTPAADKQHVVLETPHDVRADRPKLVTVVLGWLDRYLGRVN